MSLQVKVNSNAKSGMDISDVYGVKQSECSILRTVYYIDVDPY